MLGLGPLVTLGIYAVGAIALAVAIGTAITSLKEHIAAPYVAAQVKSTQKVVDEAKAETAAAKQDALTSKGNSDRCDLALNVQKGETKSFEDKATKAQAEARKQKAENDRLQASFAPRLAELQAYALAKPKAMKCEEELSKARGILEGELYRRRGGK